MRNSGFTLIELLIAVTVLAALSMMIYISFSSVVNSMEIARFNAEDLQTRRLLQESIAHNLRSIYADTACADPSFQLFHEKKSGPFGAGDSLRFVASLPMQGGNSMPGQFIEVFYELAESLGLEEQDDLAPEPDVFAASYVLRITERPLVLQSAGLEFSGGSFEPEPRIREIPINAIGYRFYDNGTEDWVETWDSLAEERLPWAVEVSVYFARGHDAAMVDYQAGIDAAANPDMTMIVTLPMGAGTEAPFVDWNHVRHIEEMQDVLDDSGQDIGGEGEVGDGGVESLGVLQ